MQNQLKGNPIELFKIAANMAVEGGYIIDEENEKVIMALIYYYTRNLVFQTLKFDDQKLRLDKGIILIGNPGSGKTILLEILNMMVNNIPQLSAQVHHSIDMATRIKKDGIPHIKANIMLDELGKEASFTRNYKEIEPMHDFIQSRYILWSRNRHLTNFTTMLQPVSDNPNEVTIQSRYGAHSLSRLKQMCNIFGLGLSSTSRDRRADTIPVTLDNLKHIPKFFETQKEREDRISTEAITKSYQRIKDEPPAQHVGLGTRLKEQIGKYTA